MPRKYTFYVLIGFAVVVGVVGAYEARVHFKVPVKDTRIIHYVALSASGADPANLLIKTGEYVEFDSKDGKTHDIASGIGNGDGEKHDHQQGEVESGDFGPDEGYLVLFKTVGTFYFHDHLYPNINESIGAYDPALK